MNYTPLSFLLNSLNAHRDINNIEDKLKVQAIDAQLREARQGYSFPWNLIKGKLKIIDGVSEYKPADDHDELAYIEYENIDNFSSAARFYNTSLQQFYEDVNSSRNLLTDVWRDGSRILGVKDKQMSLGSSVFSATNDTSIYSVSGDAVALSLGTSAYDGATPYLQVSCNGNSNPAIIESNLISPVSISSRRYAFTLEIMFPLSVNNNTQLSVDVSLGSSSLDTYTAHISHNFQGKELVSGEWNTIGFYLDDRLVSVSGNPDISNLTYCNITVQSNEDEDIFIHDFKLSPYKQLDYWYYSFYNVASSGSLEVFERPLPDKEFFVSVSDQTGAIDLGDALLGPTKWADYVLWGAAERLLAEINNPQLFSFVMRKKAETTKKMAGLLPQTKQVVTTKRHRFNNDPLYTFGNPYDNN